ncbi:MAG: hypothetical protein IKV41_01990 [Oscillospiraceae bacterium]|nr:hypothetical protein [Oscillospiraceae bacterium]
MKKYIKQSVGAILVCAMVISATSVCAFAKGGPNGGGRGQQMGNPPAQSMNADGGRGGRGGQRNKPADGEMPIENGENQGRFEDGMMGMGNRGKSFGVDDEVITRLESLIEKVEDSTTKEELTNLLEAFEAAIKAEQEACADESTDQTKLQELHNAVIDARKDLMTAIKDAGIAKTNRPQNGDKLQREGKPFGMIKSFLPTEKIEQQIAALTDEDVKAQLTELLEAYNTALENAKTAAEAEEVDETELETLKTALNEAKDELTTALKEAGVEMGKAVPKDSGAKIIKAFLPTEKIEQQIAALTDEEVKAQLTELLEAYNTALENAKTAAQAEEVDETELETLKTALNEAKDELKTALKEAGIDDIKPDRPEKSEQKETPVKDKQENSGGFIAGISNWFSNLFK